MTLYQVAVALHAVAAVLGLGQVAALVTIASFADSKSLPLIHKLMWTVTWSMLALLVTGIMIIASLRGVYADTWWLRISFLLMLVVGALVGRTRGVVRKAAGVGSDGLFASLRRTGWAISVIVAVIVVLMSAKPF